MALTNDMRTKIVSEARRLVGVRFRHAGRTPQGVDCIGLLVVAYGAVGIAIAAPADYPRRPGTAYTFSQAASFATRISADDAEPGDVVQMAYANVPVHFGILSGDGRVIHSAAILRRVVENTIPKNGDGRAIAFWRIRGGAPWRS